MATAETAQALKLTRGQSPPQSKRDKKRQQLSDKLAVLSDQFSRDRDRHYREELQKIQVDVNLVSRVDPYADRPLDVIEREYRELSQATANGGDRPNRSLLEMAGPSFQDWAHQVEDLVEHRDYEMTTHKFEYERKMQEHYNTHAYKIEVAKREHKALSSTLKDRLINTITSKKFRLSKEKEALEINDSSALLLHPNQFSLTNPASPGGTHGKRTTRLRREMEEMPGFSENKKRKRNGVDDDGSPAPMRRALDTSNTTPLWQNDRIRAMRKETGPVYSIDKLFTDKELSMTYNTAAVAAHKHLLTRRDANGNVIPSPDESETGNGEANEEDKDDDLSAPTMERQPSHATRSTRGGQNNTQNFYDDKVLGMEALANFEHAGNLDRMCTQEPKLPPLIHSQYSKAYVKSESNTPTSLSQDDAQHDLMVMRVFKLHQRDHGVGSNLEVPHGGRSLLEAMAQPRRPGRYVAYIQGQRPSVDRLSEQLGVPNGTLREEPGGVLSALAGVPGVAAAGANHSSPSAPPMSRQSSFGGGAAMTRTSSGRGRRRG
ncbi:Sds3-like-domain-containing protein [Pseudomassariella vexata]|uniref:Sds3-like-domain-containing protein n=1 Tax=Pseudomassariella vexata TaxID=1141098 RepID=A0A1Y2D730_9PEZI|nr:Sds3-like-domain-containing protein [Pseudomassariella vexata]ORY55082.1 Sds3-like-domain-containing protein [Pseudomassariella vexata]